MNPNPQNPFGMNQQMGRGPPQRNGKSTTQTQKCEVLFIPHPCVGGLSNLTADIV